MTKIYNLKKQKIQKVSKLPKIDTKPKVERHDVLFDILHLKSLLNTNNYVNNVCNYMNKFFLKYGTDIFMDDGITFNLLSLEEAKKKIPSDYKKSIITSTGNREITKEISLRSYFESEYFLKSNEAKLT